MNKLIYKAESYEIIGACFEVYNNLGPGFLESVYQEALHREFLIRGIPHQEQVGIQVFYKGEALNKQYRADFLCFDDIICELKAVKSLLPIDEAIAINYLKATQTSLALLINFGEEQLRYQRYVFAHRPN